MSMANESICSAKVVIWSMSRDGADLMVGSSEILPVVRMFAFEDNFNNLVVLNHFMLVSASFLLQHYSICALCPSII